MLFVVCVGVALKKLARLMKAKENERDTVFYWNMNKYVEHRTNMSRLHHTYIVEKNQFVIYDARCLRLYGHLENAIFNLFAIVLA